jgi:D-glycero-alpha-D-manno-heptose-7-phosphate kinase
MIISQTPYRVSFAGGGTDLPAFYREEYGAVFSVTIARHIYVTVHGRFTDDIRVAYSKMEVVEDARQLKHELAREAIHMLGLPSRLEITTIGDVPGGTGMGSSSTAIVGLLHALHAFKGEICSRSQLAEEACRIEIDHLGKPIGKQDQYAAAFGGLNYIRFNPDETVDVEPVPVCAGLMNDLESHTLLMYTAQQRSADGILKRQSDGTADKRAVLTQMRDLADAMRHSLAGQGDLDDFASLLHEGWQLKRSLGFGITNPQVDQWYEAARKVGAQGGKLLGAGGGGFLLLMAPPERHEAIRATLGRPKELPFRIDRNGSRIIFVSEQH